MKLHGSWPNCTLSHNKHSRKIPRRTNNFNIPTSVLLSTICPHYSHRSKLYPPSFTLVKCRTCHANRGPDCRPVLHLWRRWRITLCWLLAAGLTVNRVRSLNAPDETPRNQIIASLGSWIIHWLTRLRIFRLHGFLKEPIFVCQFVWLCAHLVVCWCWRWRWRWHGRDLRLLMCIACMHYS
ncbi:hypothetical protein B0H63DRAFT_484165 [Podospora didyma]|uniref:Uncharacterized protein n=1 Tax=Podospora didyma TaxID=330526 RepID=A0AAE0N6N9_9PEZI|nr:hypothetical protein B0H63DRAFT_484165 [Podospora didyma]